MNTTNDTGNKYDKEKPLIPIFCFAWLRTMTSLMNVSYIITHRGNAGSRLHNLLVTLSWLSTVKNVDVILVEQDDEPHLADLAFSTVAPLKYIFAYNKQLFNRSWGFNVGFRYADGDVLAFSDSDIFMDRDELTNCFQQCHRYYDAINPYSKIIDLPKNITKDFQEKPDLIKNGFSRNYEGEERKCINFCGGLVLFKRDVFEMIGGFDERFSGWGGEDDAMSFFKLKELVQCKLEMPYIAYHLWHERTIQDTMEQPNYAHNKRLLDEYKTLTREELILLCEDSRGSMGNPDKYKTPSESVTLTNKLCEEPPRFVRTISNITQDRNEPSI